MSAMCQVLSRCWGQQGEDETSLPQDNLCDTCSHRALARRLGKLWRGCSSGAELSWGAGVACQEG